jgi:quercetin dioxygenase-like cupin family protein
MVTRVSADQVWTKVSGKDTADAWSMFESRVPSGLAVPLHQHHSQEEWFWVLKGDFMFEVGGEIYRLTPGMSLLAPRQVPHRWKKSNESDGRLLILVQPAGGMEGFFERFAQMSPEQRQNIELLKQLFAACEMELLGPPFDDSAP